MEQKTQISTETSQQRLLLYNPDLNGAREVWTDVDNENDSKLRSAAGVGELLWPGEANASPHQHPYLATIMSVSFLIGIIVFILFRV